LLQPQPVSIVQLAAQPSPASRLPSSHASTSETTTPSPHIAGAPRWIARCVIVPPTMRVEPAPDDTTLPASRPSTRAMNVSPATLGSKSTTMLSPVVARARAGSGRRIGANATVGSLPAWTKLAEIESWSNGTSYVTSSWMPVSPASCAAQPATRRRRTRRKEKCFMA